MAVKYGPTKGEYIFRLCSGMLVILLLIVGFSIKGFPVHLVTIETFLFCGGFAAFLIIHSGYRLWTGGYRIPQPRGKS
jgi:hypothetical protein